MLTWAQPAVTTAGGQSGSSGVPSPATCGVGRRRTGSGEGGTPAPGSLLPRPEKLGLADSESVMQLWQLNLGGEGQSQGPNHSAQAGQPRGHTGDSQKP